MKTAARRCATSPESFPGRHSTCRSSVAPRTTSGRAALLSRMRSIAGTASFRSAISRSLRLDPLFRVPARPGRALHLALPVPPQQGRGLRLRAVAGEVRELPGAVLSRTHTAQDPWTIEANAERPSRRSSATWFRRPARALRRVTGDARALVADRRSTSSTARATWRRRARSQAAAGRPRIVELIRAPRGRQKLYRYVKETVIKPGGAVRARSRRRRGETACAAAAPQRVVVARALASVKRGCSTSRSRADTCAVPVRRTAGREEPVSSEQ